jgi:hypothetical protein
MGKLIRFFNAMWAMMYNFFFCYFFDRPRRVSFVNSVVSFQERQRLSASFPSLEFTDIFSGSPALDLQFQNFSCLGGNVAFAELAILAAIVKTTEPRTLFEFGTYDGNTTLQLALNTPDDGIIYTIDLPPDNLNPKLRLDPGDRIFMGGAIPGQRFKGTAAEGKIHQVLSDSAAYNYSFLEHKVDFVFVDGAHSYEYLKNDTQHALSMLAPKGLIVWHDYLVWNDVTDFLNRLSKSLPLIHLKATSLVLYKAPH